MKIQKGSFVARPSHQRSFFLGLAWFFLIFLALGGCYWTPDESRGSISLRIQAPSSGGQVTASDTVSEPAYLLLVYVIEEAFIRQDPQGKMEHIFSIWEASFNEEDFEGEGSSPGSLGSISLGTPALASQFQGFAELLGYESSEGGTVLFSNLNPDSTYLVVAEIHNIHAFLDGEEDHASWYGYAVSRVRSGENRAVNLSLGHSFDDYLAFLAERYDLDLDEDPDDPPEGQIVIEATLVDPQDQTITIALDSEINLDEITELIFTAPDVYESYEWTVNDMEGWDNSNTITISESEISDVIFPGLNTVHLEVWKDGAPYGEGSFTFTVTETILGEVVIEATLVDPQDQTITIALDSEINLDEITELTFTAPDIYDSYEWTVNDIEGWDNSNTITISESEISDVIVLGENTVDLMVWKGTTPYETTFTFTATRTILGEVVIEATLVNPQDEEIELIADDEINLNGISQITFTAPADYESYEWTVNGNSDWPGGNILTISDESEIDDVIVLGLNIVYLEVWKDGEPYSAGSFTFTAIFE
ncbi:hypothetical protein [Alkalispirochaeta alkalica]|uniref:hypothetical protein n=1 Tax=Alkalispirochaeta alkalica TaxID=46356 RepID=UPI0003A5FB9F|nr:hypothetical protein [Alkalispirochaeta alkalica]